MAIVIDSNGVIDIAASTPGTYRITYTTAGTCPNSSTQDITINALPTISIAGSDFCAGQSTTLTATPSTGTFVWEVDTGSGYNVISGQTNNTISVSAAGDYRAKVTDANGCTSSYSNVLAITQFASPSVTIATVPGTTICSGDTATLTANATGGSGSGYTYLWSNSATTQAISVSPTTTTTYSVTVTDSNGCTATASQEITASTAGTTIASVNNDATMSFNGTDQYVQLSNEVNHGATNTLSFWINSSNTVTKDIFGANTSQGYLLKALNATDTVSYRTSSGARTFDLSGLSSNPMKDGDWHHIAFTRNSSNLIQLYVDGSPVGSAQSLSGNTLFEIIGANYAKSLFFDGKLDEVAIWNSALSSCDIKGIYDATTTVSGQPKTANLLDANTTIPAPVYWNRMGDS